MPRVTPFDLHANHANKVGYHNHRVNTHSDIISDGIVRDLREICPFFAADLDRGVIGCWKNRDNPWGRKRETDLIIAEPIFPKTFTPPEDGMFPWQGASAIPGTEPNPSKVRIVSEHKSIITAHRNRSARHDDLNNLYQEAFKAGESVIVTATVMVGIAHRYLNVANGIKRRFKTIVQTDNGKVKKIFNQEIFERDVLSRIRDHDKRLWEEFSDATSLNTMEDIRNTFELFKTLPRRPQKNRNQPGYDAILIVPVDYDNVNPARIARGNPFGIDIDKDYETFLNRIAGDYTILWSKPT